MADTTDTPDAPPAASPFPAPSLEDLQHWTSVMGRAQQMMLEHMAQQFGEATEKAAETAGPGHAGRIVQGSARSPGPRAGRKRRRRRPRRWPRRRIATSASRRRNGGTIRSSTRFARPIC